MKKKDGGTAQRRKGAVTPAMDTKKTEPKQLSTVPPPLPLKKQLYLTAAAVLLSYILVFFGKYGLLEWWNNPMMQHCGEPAQVTNDAYLFLSGADGFGRGMFENFSTFTRFFHQISGVGYGTLGIWLPVFLIPLIAIPICWLFFLFGHPFAGVVASLFMLNAPSFFGRTVPGYYDNDMFDLFFPIAFGAALVVVLTPLLRERWWGKTSPPAGVEEALPTYKLWGHSLFAGLIASAYVWCYPTRLPVPLMMSVFALVVGWFALREGERARFAGAMAIIMMLFTAPLHLSLLFAAVAIAVAYFRPQECAERKIGYYLLGGFIASYIVAGNVAPIVERFINNLMFYGAGGKTIASVRTVIPVPSFSVSVSEIQRVPFAAMVEMTAHNLPLFIAGVLGTILMVVMRPSTIPFIPLFVLGIGTPFLGARFAIFACLVVAIGATFLLAEVLTRLFKKRVYQLIIYAVAAFAFFVFTLQPAGIAFPPILNKAYAEALCKVRGKTEKGSQFWAWWDWGHPITYYARTLPFVDGGINELGCYIVAVVYITDSPHNAASIIRYAATTQMINAMNNREHMQYDEEDKEKYAALGYNVFQPLMPIHHLNDAGFLDKTLRLVVAGMKEKPERLPDQYLAVTWDNMRFSHWVGYFGKWDTRLMRSTNPQIARLPQGNYAFDPVKGIITINNRQVPLNEMDIIDNKGLHRKKFPNKSGNNLVKNDLTGDLYIADDTFHRSMMYRMLVEDPQLFKDYFEIVVDHFPFARIYKLKRG